MQVQVRGLASNCTNRTQSQYTLRKKAPMQCPTHNPFSSISLEENENGKRRKYLIGEELYRAEICFCVLSGGFGGV